MSSRTYWILFVIFAIAHTLTLSLDVLDIDSSQFAEIAREMVEEGTWMKLPDNGRKYLDKPFLSFWFLKISYLIFGVSNFSYRFFPVILNLLSAHLLFRIAVLYGGSIVLGRIASLLFLSSFASMSLVLDPKIDVFLNFFLVLTLYFYYLGKRTSPKYFYLMWLSISLAIVTKGPIGIVLPGLAIGGDIFFRRDWELLKRLQLPLGIFLVLIFPAIWCFYLYRDFKEYGVAFFLYIQSFGRFYKDLYDSGYKPLYFWGVWTWGMFPFSILYLYFLGTQVWKNRAEIFQKKLISYFEKSNLEKKDFTFIIWFLVFLTLLSFSKFRLPQYAMWAIPGSVVVVAEFFVNQKVPKIFLNLLSSLLLLVLCVSAGFVFEWNLSYLIFLATGIVLLGAISLYTDDALSFSFLSLALVWCSATLFFFPLLSSYQPSRAIGEIVQRMEPDEKTLLTYRIASSKRSFAFYSQRIFRNVYDINTLERALEKTNQRLIVYSFAYKEELVSHLPKHLQFQELDCYLHAKVATPKLSFFVAKTRELETKKICLGIVKKL